MNRELVRINQLLKEKLIQISRNKDILDDEKLMVQP